MSPSRTKRTKLIYWKQSKSNFVSFISVNKLYYFFHFIHSYVCSLFVPYISLFLKDFFVSPLFFSIVAVYHTTIPKFIHTQKGRYPFSLAKAKSHDQTWPQAQFVAVCVQQDVKIRPLPILSTPTPYRYFEMIIHRKFLNYLKLTKRNKDNKEKYTEEVSQILFFEEKVAQIFP